MIIPSCPKCGRQGHLHKQVKKGTEYWYVAHGSTSDGDHCWLGKEKREVVVIDKKKGKVEKTIGVEDE